MKKPLHTAQESVLAVMVALLLTHLFFYESKWLIYACLAVGVSSILSKYIANKIHFLWWQLARLLNAIILKVVLSAVFFLVLTPLAWLSKLFGNQSSIQLKDDSDSTFIERNKSFVKEDFKKPW
ncbi:MAG: hypothetical protein ACI81T_002298 [Bacteroidia bacterium]|jgi:hypothetical protein